MTQQQPERSTKDLVRAAVSGWLGTALEFMDFQLYSLGAALVFHEIFFPEQSAAMALILAMGTYGAGYIARIVGAWFFGKMGDSIGRKRVLFITITMMGICTTLIGVLPTYAQIGIFAPVLLVTLRIVQGLGAGAEISGAGTMLAEYAPKGKRGIISSLVAMGTNCGTLSATAIWAIMFFALDRESLIAWGWRVPFIFSAVLVIIGLYVRVSLHETPVFAKVAAAKKQVKVPLGTLLSKHLRLTILGTFIMLATYTLFYIMTVYSMAYSTAPLPVGLGLPRNEVLWMLMMAVIGFGVMVPIAGVLADRFGRRKSMITITTLIILFGLFVFQPLLGSGNPTLIMAFLLIGLSLMGLTFGPMGALLPELFPTEVRYTGASFSYNVASILGASVAPYIAAWLTGNYGLAYVGYYLASMAVLTLIALLLTHETREQAL